VDTTNRDRLKRQEESARFGGALHSALLAARCVAADNRCRYHARIDATPRGAGKFNTLDPAHAYREPRPVTSFQRYTR
jgi:hypothetical protein